FRSFPFRSFPFRFFMADFRAARVIHAFLTRAARVNGLNHRDSLICWWRCWDFACRLFVVDDLVSTPRWNTAVKLALDLVLHDEPTGCQRIEHAFHLYAV